MFEAPRARVRPADGIGVTHVTVLLRNAESQDVSGLELRWQLVSGFQLNPHAAVGDWPIFEDPRGTP